MKVHVLAAMLGLAFAGPGLVGCDEEISHEKDVKRSNDKVETREKTVSETPDGGVKVEEKKSVDRTDD